MGNVNFGAPREIIDKMRTVFGITTFVETGTFRGETAAWASERFDRVYTIEGSPDFRHEAQERHRDKTNIEFLLGDSGAVLKELVPRLSDGPALFWLDAHWMPGSFGEKHECPLLEEIKVIHQSIGEHFILIDDARLFLAPPPLPHRARDWPDIGAVLAALNPPEREPNYCVIHNDVIISVPETSRDVMRDYHQAQTTAAFQGGAQQPPHPAIRLLRAIKRRISG